MRKDGQERPWIHPEAIATLMREGRIEDKDIPALIRLYVRAQVEWHRVAGRDFWLGNAKIAKRLGVEPYDVENAIGRSEMISRVNGGKGRGADKRFVVAAPAKPTEVTSQSDGCHQSDRRVETVKLTDATSQIDGCHRKRRKRNKDKGTQKEGREEDPTSLPVGDSSSLISEEEAKEMLTGYDLVDPRELPHAYYSLLTKCAGSPLNASEKDIGYATRCLDSLPENLRRLDVLSAWLIWWCRARPRKRDKTWWFTSFSGSWANFRQRAIAIAEAADKAEREQEEAELRARHEAFVAGLPSMETILAAIEAVPDPETFGYNDALRWVHCLAKSIGLMLAMADSPYEYSYIESTYRAVEYDPGKMILNTKRFFARIAQSVLERLHGDEGRDKLAPTKIKWENYCAHFGLCERDARGCGHRIPEKDLNYRRPPPAGGQGDKDCPIP